MYSLLIYLILFIHSLLLPTEIVTLIRIVFLLNSKKESTSYPTKQKAIGMCKHTIVCFRTSRRPDRLQIIEVCNLKQSHARGYAKENKLH